MPPARRARNASTPVDPGPIPADLELSKLYVKDLRSLCSRLNLTTTGGHAVLMKRLEEAQTHTENLPGTPPLFKMAASTWKIKIIKLPLNCNFSSFSAKSRSYWTGSRYKMGFYQPPSSPKYNRLFEAPRAALYSVIACAMVFTLREIVATDKIAEKAAFGDAAAGEILPERQKRSSENNTNGAPNLNNVHQRLQALEKKSETLHLKTFGAERYTNQQCDVVNLHLQGSQGEIEISALCFPKIRSAVSAKVNVHNYTHLQGLELAEASIVEGDAQNIDFLIGSHYFFDVVSGDVIRGESAPLAVSSMFAWILSGHTSVEESREKFSTTNLIIERPKLMSLSRYDIHSENDELSITLKKFLDTDLLGVRDEPFESQLNGGEFLKNIHFDEKERGNEVFLPWKEGHFHASNEYNLCHTSLIL
ncbi:hypothetical protein AWC38_SpisGene19971 [Stylophora pistillata]|uniref:SAP domain-containing protein n=1 Tax=Stylophora pistillata TaxID=50429 RepID=A0A2B4RG65_STYPI|nr:hypothetical protein AWC38_SpisGene19971 [Stylophora pistillata]